MDRRSKVNRGQKQHRSDWEFNQEKLYMAFIECLKESPAFPSLARLHKKTGLSISRISKHLKELDINKMVCNSPIKLLFPKVLFGLAQAGTQGDAPAAKLYSQLAFGYVEKSKHEVEIDLSKKSDAELVKMVEEIIKSKSENQGE